MRDHIAVARRFPGIETNTAYSFGLDDQEFVVAFDADDPSEFLDLVQELRAHRVERLHGVGDADLHVHLGFARAGAGRARRRGGGRRPRRSARRARAPPRAAPRSCRA